MLSEVIRKSVTEQKRHGGSFVDPDKPKMQIKIEKLSLYVKNELYSLKAKLPEDFYNQLWKISENLEKIVKNQYRK